MVGTGGAERRQARRFTFAPSLLGRELLGGGLGRLVRLELEERGRDFAARDEAGDLRLPERGAGGVRLPAELVVGDKR